MQENNDLFKRPVSPDEKELEQSKTRIFDTPVDDATESNQYSDIYSNNQQSKKQRKKKKSLPGFVRPLVILIISVVLAGLIILAAIDFIGLTFGTDVSAEIDIKSGFSTAQIADELYEKKVIKFPLLFRLYSKLQGADGQYQYGIYEISDSQGYSSIIKTLKNPGQTGDIVTVTIPEGYSVRKIAELMQEKGVCTKDEFISAVKNGEYKHEFIKSIPTEKVYYRLEGYLYPDTYDFFADDDGKSGQECAEKAVKKMLDRMESVLDDDVFSQAKKKGYSVHEILTMASIVELEASGYPNDMAKVAQVFYNRLRWTDQPARLGSTPTSEYPDSRYDTNSYEGLPPGPLCSPSAEALNAALYPDTSIKEDYFVTDKNMKFYYTSSYDEHNELIEQLKSEGLWN